MKLFLAIVILIPLAVFAQPGFLGRKNGLELTIQAMPALQPKVSFENNEVTRKYRLFYSNYNITYSRVVSRKIELNLGYSYTPVRTYSHNALLTAHETYVDYNQEETSYLVARSFLNDRIMHYHQGFFNFRWYRLGSLAPVGKYLGIGVQVGYGNYNNKVFQVGIKGPETHNTSFVVKNQVLHYGEIISHQDPITNLQFNVQIGRIYPINQRLLFSAGVTCPLLDLYFGSFFEVRHIEDFLDYWDDFKIAGSVGSEVDLSSILIQGLRKSNFITIDLGLRYVF